MNYYIEEEIKVMLGREGFRKQTHYERMKFNKSGSKNGRARRIN